eukprot:CAMPEP_0114987424 /NCGR_PEP_ID=MMETSP0216-20121206/9000_1 /TAXON_ID=223996 /ORGANISM="Protocruzia adherens, Strain Boccale" /LENGTH=255 /DNA_ID=CAMNT_0002350021 /DNA_START=40 /DNA_END=808 /DNA_ORIENTATION=+
MASEEAQQELSSLMHTYICHDCGMHFLSESYFKQHVMRYCERVVQNPLLSEKEPLKLQSSKKPEDLGYLPSEISASESSQPETKLRRKQRSKSQIDSSQIVTERHKEEEWYKQRGLNLPDLEVRRKVHNQDAEILKQKLRRFDNLWDNTNHAVRQLELRAIVERQELKNEVGRSRSKGMRGVYTPISPRNEEQKQELKTEVNKLIDTIHAYYTSEYGGDDDSSLREMPGARHVKGGFSSYREGRQDLRWAGIHQL